MEDLSLCYTFTEGIPAFTQQDIEKSFRDNEIGFVSMNLDENKLFVTFDTKENYEIGTETDSIFDSQVTWAPAPKSQPQQQDFVILYIFPEQNYEISKEDVKKYFSELEIGIKICDIKHKNEKTEIAVEFKTQGGFNKGNKLDKLFGIKVEKKILEEMPENDPVSMPSPRDLIVVYTFPKIMRGFTEEAVRDYFSMHSIGIKTVHIQHESGKTKLIVKVKSPGDFNAAKNIKIMFGISVENKILWSMP